MPTLVTAVEHIRSLPGASRPHLFRADDGNFYVVKFSNNPQGPRTLINEYLANRLAARIGLPVPMMAVVAVPEVLIRNSTALRMPFGDYSLMCSAGIQFGSRLCGEPPQSILFDFLPGSLISLVHNPEAILGAFVFDRWVGNIDRRQFVFVSRRRPKSLHAVLIDHGLCFGGTDWYFRDAPRDGLAPFDNWYKNVQDWDAFEPWIRRIEALSLDEVKQALHGLPVTWNLDPVALDTMLNTLDARIWRLRSLIREALAGAGSPFVQWRDFGCRKSVAVSAVNAAASLTSVPWNTAG